MMATFSQINWIVVYLIGLIITAILIGYHAVVTMQHKGRTPKKVIFTLTSLLEGSWLLVSGALLYYGDFNQNIQSAKVFQILKVVPMAYIIYCIFGWAYGLYLLKDEAENIKDVDDIAMPDAYLHYSKAFSLVIILTAILLLSWLWQLGDFSLPW